MRTRKIIFNILLLTFFVLNLFTINSNAANETFKLNISTEEEYLSKGQEFQIIISISDLTAQDGLTYVGGKINYDSNIISYVSGKEEFITQEGDIEGLYSVEVSEYSDEGSNIAIYYLDANIRALKLTFKLQENVTLNQFSIGFTDFIGTNVDNLNISATAEDVQLTLNVKTPVNQISLNKTETSIRVNQIETLIATILPENATNKTIVWTSSDSNVVIVDNGIIYGVKEGTAIITATAVDNNISTSCTVNVLAENVNNNNEQNQNNNNDNANNNSQDQNDNSQNQNNNIQMDNNSNNNQSAQVDSNGQEEDNTVTNQKIPQTGISMTLLIIILLLMIFTIILFKKYRNLKEIN